MTWLLLYFLGGPVTGVLMSIDDIRRGGVEKWWWLAMMCSVPGLFWPFMLVPVICDLIDGPYEPRHRVKYF